MSFEVVHAYLFGGVKYVDLLALAMIIDIVTGVLKAIKEKRLRSRTALFGYARKIGIFGIIICANIIDQVLDLQGMVAFGTVLFYLANEILSITENCAKLGMKVPSVILDKLHAMQNEEDKK